MSNVLSSLCCEFLICQSDFVARHLSGCHIAQGGRYETDKSATGDTEDEIRGSV